MQVSTKPGGGQFLFGLNADGTIREVRKRQTTGSHDPWYPRQNLPQAFYSSFGRDHSDFVRISPDAEGIIRSAVDQMLPVNPTSLMRFRGD